VLCLPGDLPEIIKVDLCGLHKGSSLHLSDIPMPKGVKAVTHGGDKNPVVVSVVMVAAAEEAPVAEATAPEAAAKPDAKADAKPAAKAEAKPAAKK